MTTTIMIAIVLMTLYILLFRIKDVLFMLKYTLHSINKELLQIFLELVAQQLIIALADNAIGSFMVSKSLKFI